MSLNDQMTALMSAVRSTTGLTDKLSIDQATQYVQGLTPVNLFSIPSDSPQTFNINDGDWGAIIGTVTLAEGTYCLSVNVLSITTNQYTSRVVNGTGTAIPIDGSMANLPWGLVGSTWNTGATLMVAAFKVTQAGAFQLGFSGDPFAKGEIKFNNVMLNKGALPLPYVANKE